MNTTSVDVEIEGMGEAIEQPMEYVGPTEAGRILGLSRWTVRNLAKQGDLATFTTTGENRPHAIFERSQVEELAIRRASGMNGNGRKRGRKPKVSSTTLKESIRG